MDTTTAAPASPAAATPAPAAEGPPSVEEFLKSFKEPPAVKLDAPKKDEDPTKPDAPAPKPEEPPPAAAAPQTPEQVRATKALSAASRLHAKALEKAAAADAVLADAKAFQDLKKLPLRERMKAAFGTDDVTVLAKSIVEEGDTPAAPTDADRLAVLEKAAADREAADKKTEAERTIQAVQDDLFGRIKAAGDRFEAIAAKGEAGLQLVWDTAAEYLALHGEIGDPLEIADAVEQGYIDEAAAIAATKKFQARAGAQAAKSSNATTPPPPLPGATTLNSKDGPEVPGGDDLPMDPSERHARIMRDIERGVLTV